MKEVKKCSLCGIAFTMDTDAYETLSEYLESLRKNYRENADGEEIVADIEARIAELILSAQDNTHAVSKPLVLDIIAQMGSADDISGTDPADARRGGPRIPRRLYRDAENARLGGVCSGIGKYFDIDPVWVRLALFAPLLLNCFQWIPPLRWTGPMTGNLFGIFVVCYLIMWFAVPTARTARQKLEMNGEKITEQTIRRTAGAQSGEPGGRARSVVAEIVSVLGKVVLILLKIFAGILVFGFILTACGLIIALFALLVGGGDIPLAPHFLNEMSIWIPVLGIFVVLVPIILLIYVMMCMIASRKPSGRTVAAIFILWLLGFIALGTLGIRGRTGNRIRQKYSDINRIMESELIIDGDTTTLRRMLEKFDREKVIEETPETMHISVPSKGVEIIVDKKRMRIDAGLLPGFAEKDTTAQTRPQSGTPETRRIPAVRMPEANASDD